MGVELKVKILVYKKENKNSDKLYKTQMPRQTGGN